MRRGGAELSQKPSSTLGYERRANPFLAIRDEHAFVERLIGSLPPRPPQVERVVALNLAPVLPELSEPPVLGAAELGDLLAAGGLVVDGAPPIPSTRDTSRAPSTCRSLPARSARAPGG